MRRLLLPFLLLLPIWAVASTPIKVLVKDPQQRPVAGARVTLLRAESNAAVAVRYTDAAGVVLFSESGSRVEVLAPGFAPRTLELKSAASVTVQLAIATQSETVNVTAARTELTPEQSGAPSAVIGADRIELQQPVSVADSLRFLPGTVLGTTGRRGGQASLFVRGGDSRYNKVIVDGVTINDAGGTFDFGVVPTQGLERIELVRGAESTLYGSDAMTSVVQLFSATGSTTTPELRFGADGGTFSTAHGYASLAGAYKRFDYGLFADQSGSAGQGINDDYSNASQGANLGLAVTEKLSARLRLRHSNNRSGVQSFWDFNGQPILPPDNDQFARQNNFLAALDLTADLGRWKHTLTGSEYHHVRLNQDQVADRGCAFPLFLDCDFKDKLDFNRAALDYRGEFTPRSWFRAVFGYRFEDENGFVDQDFSGFVINSKGLRRNHAGYVQGVVLKGRFSLTAGVRVEDNESFGTKAVPRVTAAYLVWRGNSVLSGTRLRFAYGEGIKEPRLEESFGAVGAFGPVTLPNPNLRAEQNRSFEAGFTQGLGAKSSFSANYYHNLFRDQIAFSFDPVTFTSQYINLNEALAHGAEVEFHSRPTSRLSFDAAYTYTSTQVLKAPLAFDPLLQAGSPLVRRPKHSGNLLVSYVAGRWGANLGGTFLGRKVDSDFLGLGVTHSAGYARLDLGGWYAIHPRVTAYANIENLLNRKYEEAAGYPALKANFRAGFRFRIGGE